MLKRVLKSIAPLALLCAAAPAFALDLTALMSLLAQRSGGQARFTEERVVAGLDLPLRSSGRLTFAAPDRFERHTTEPRAESLEVQGNVIVLKRGGRTRQTTLDAVPEMAALVDALRGTLTGDAAVLRKQFRTEVAGNEARWTLTLTPTDARLWSQVRQMQIGGERSDVRSIELWLAGGDRSTMSIEPLQPAR
jgi:hypothetical protein